MFKKYQSITNTNSRYLQEALNSLGHKRAVVLEKVHGANYQVSYDGTGFTVGSRRKQLGTSESFYSDLSIRGVFCDRVKSLYELIKEQALAQEKAALSGAQALRDKGKTEEADEYYRKAKPSISPNFRSIRVRGELYGGMYNHPNVAVLPNLARVGKGKVSYAQNVSIAAFALEIDDVPLGWLETKILLFSADIPTVPCLFVGTFEECVEWSAENKHNPTLIPNGTPWLDSKGNPILQDGSPQALPQIEGNIREGHVITFLEPEFLPDGRIIMFKDVNSEYAENQRKVPRKVEVKLTKAESDVVAEVSKGFTEERLVTQFSYEDYSRRDFTSVMGKVVSDCLGEARVESALVRSFLEDTSAKRRKVITKELLRIAHRELRETFFSICSE